MPARRARLLPASMPGRWRPDSPSGRNEITRVW
jgi:hypothetical protein